MFTGNLCGSGLSVCMCVFTWYKCQVSCQRPPLFTSQVTCLPFLMLSPSLFWSRKTVGVRKRAVRRQGAQKEAVREEKGGGKRVLLGVWCFIGTGCLPSASLQALNLHLSFVCVLQGGKVGLWDGYFCTGGSLWYHHVCRLVGSHTEKHMQICVCVCVFMTLIFTSVWQSLDGPPTGSWTFPCLVHTLTYTHACICSDTRLPPFYTKLPRFLLGVPANGWLRQIANNCILTRKETR